MLHVDQRITVAEALDVVEDTQYNVSRNLKMLFKAGLLAQEKQGKWVYYQLTEQTEPYCIALVESVRYLPSETFADIIERCILRLSLRVDGECVVGPNSDGWKTLINKKK